MSTQKVSSVFFCFFVFHVKCLATEGMAHGTWHLQLTLQQYSGMVLAFPKPFALFYCIIAVFPKMLTCA